MKLCTYKNIVDYNTLETIINAQKDKTIKGTLFEEFTYYLFKLHPNYKFFTTNIWLYNDIPQSIKENLSLPNKDMGIDLLLENNKEYYAIQCKYRKNRDTVVSWKELATFYGLTFGLNNKIKGGFLVTNTYNLHKLAASSTKVIPIYGTFFDDWLDEQFFINMQEIINNVKLTLRHAFKPREYQYTIINSCINHFKTESRGYLEMICGSGKTLTAYWVDKNMDNTLTLVLVPSLYLLSQFYKDWVYIGININFILVGSDADVGEVDYHTNGIILITDPTVIKSKIKDKTVIISTYQSSDKVIAALQDIAINLCIFDEAHKTVGQAGKQFSLLISDPIKIKKRLFMTATPKVYNSQSIDNMDENILSMDNEEHYGKLIYTYNAGTAINQGYLADYNIVTMHTDSEYIKKAITNNKYINFNFEDNESHYVACALMLLNSRDMHHHLVTYHNSIKKTKLFKELLESLIKYFKYDIMVLQIDGSYSMSKRGSIIREFVNCKNVILVSAKVLNEGINIPVIDSVCFIDNRTSTIDLIQCIGRSLRLHESKTVANIFVPVLCDSMEVLEDCSAYVNLIRILKSLSSIDERIVEYFNGITAGSSVGGKIKIVNYVSNVLISEKISIDEWNKDIGCVVWRKVDSFEYYKGLLFEYCEIYKGVPKNKTKYKNQNIGSWLSNQKIKKIDNTSSNIYIRLSANNYVKKLLDEYLVYKDNTKDSIKLDQKESQMLLFEYCDTNQCTPIKNTKYKNQNIGQWLHTQKGKINNSSCDRYIKLSSNNYVKELLDKYLERKDNMKDVAKLEWEELKILLFEYSNVNKKVPSHNTKYKKQNIGAWLSNQKKKINDNCCDKYIKLSNNSYVKKSLDEYLNPNDKLDELKELLLFEYCNVNKKVPATREKYKDMYIGRWLRCQKEKINDMHSDVYIKLSSNSYVKKSLDEYLIFKDNTKDAVKLKWEEWKMLLFEYCNINKSAPKSKIKYKNFYIGMWLQTQKKKMNDNNCDIYIKLSGNNYIKKSLDDYLIYKEKNKDTINIEWDEWVVFLFEYCDSNKNAPERKIKYKGKKIGKWLSQQKCKIDSINNDIYNKLSINSYIKKSLDEYLIYKESTKDSIKLEWKELKNLLFEYCEINKSVPTYKTKYKDQRIGVWLQNQKGKINDCTCGRYIKLSNNSYVKKSLDEYLNPNKKVDAWNKWKELLFEYCDGNKKVPTGITTYKNEKIGMWFYTQKKEINDTCSDIYIKLSSNSYVKISLDEYLMRKDSTKGIVKLEWEEWKNLLFEYCNANESTPKQKQKYKNRNVGNWFSVQKRKINNNKCDRYIKLSNNSYVKNSLDKYLEKNSAASVQ